MDRKNVDYHQAAEVTMRSWLVTGLCWTGVALLSPSESQLAEKSLSVEIPMAELAVDCAQWLKLPPARLEVVVKACESLIVTVHETPDWGLALLWQEASGEVLLSVRRDVYLIDGRMRPISSLSVDAIDALLHQLLGYALLAEFGAGREKWEDRLTERADSVMSAVPGELRWEVYVDALASFGAHLLTLHSQITRALVRARIEGRDLCTHLASVPLVRLWEYAFAAGRYPGEYSVLIEGVPTSRVSAGLLQRSDKAWLVETVVGADFEGTALDDFAPLHCPSVLPVADSLELPSR